MTLENPEEEPIMETAETEEPNNEIPNEIDPMPRLRMAA